MLTEALQTLWIFTENTNCPILEGSNQPNPPLSPSGKEHKLLLLSFFPPHKIVPLRVLCNINYFQYLHRIKCAKENCLESLTYNNQFRGQRGPRSHTPNFTDQKTKLQKCKLLNPAKHEADSLTSSWVLFFFPMPGSTNMLKKKKKISTDIKKRSPWRLVCLYTQWLAQCTGQCWWPIFKYCWMNKGTTQAFGTINT